jgi:hypothetical protein
VSRVCSVSHGSCAEVDMWRVACRRGRHAFVNFSDEAGVKAALGRNGAPFRDGVIRIEEERPRGMSLVLRVCAFWKCVCRTTLSRARCILARCVVVFVSMTCRCRCWLCSRGPRPCCEGSPRRTSVRFAGQIASLVAKYDVRVMSWSVRLQCRCWRWCWRWCCRQPAVSVRGQPSSRDLGGGCPCALPELRWHR